MAFLLKASVLLAPACVVRLSERNEPLANGGVSGPSADCRVETPLPVGGPGSGPAETKFVGRYDMANPARPRSDWSGSIMTARFQGTEVTWGVQSAGELVFEQIIDDGPSEQVILGGETGELKGEGQLAFRGHTTKVPAGVHEITVVRSSEALSGPAALVPFTFGAGTTQLPPTERPRRIEIIGDSITCGYGNEGANATCPYDIVIAKRPALVPRKDANGNVIPLAGGGYEQVEGEAEIKVPASENIYLAYGSIAARNLSADISTFCFSGKGVVLNYREAGYGPQDIKDGVPQDADAKTVLPEYYQRTFASIGPHVRCNSAADCASGRCFGGLCRCDSEEQCCKAGDAPCLAAKRDCVPPPANNLGGKEGKGREVSADSFVPENVCTNENFQAWDFAAETQPQPQVVVINLGQNDFGRDFDQDSVSEGINLDTFRVKYKEFVGFVLEKRPNAHVFLAVSPMVSDKFPLDDARTNFRNILRRITDELNAEGKKKVYWLELVEMGTRYGLGCDYHPNLEVHRIMADQLTGAIRSKTCW